MYVGFLLPEKDLLFERSKKRYLRFPKANFRFIFFEKKEFSDCSRKSEVNIFQENLRYLFFEKIYLRFS